MNRDHLIAMIKLLWSVEAVAGGSDIIRWRLERETDPWFREIMAASLEVNLPEVLQNAADEATNALTEIIFDYSGVTKRMKEWEAWLVARGAADIGWFVIEDPLNKLLGRFYESGPCPSPETAASWLVEYAEGRIDYGNMDEWEELKDETIAQMYGLLKPE
jgi:hypothetical protein